MRGKVRDEEKEEGKGKRRDGDEDGDIHWEKYDQRRIWRGNWLWGGRDRKISGDISYLPSRRKKNSS